MRYSLFTVSILAIAIAGCASPKSQLIGKWNGKASLSTSEAKTDTDKLVQGFANSIASLANSTLEFKADGTYSMTLIATMEGTYDLKDRTVTLHPTKFAGITATDSDSSKQKTMNLELSSDGKTLKPSGVGDKDFSYVYTKEGA